MAMGMRDWGRVNDNLVKRGSLFVDLFLDKWDEQLRLTNKTKAGMRGPKFEYPNVLFNLTAFLSVLQQFRQ